jgi:hypothetical protein
MGKGRLEAFSDGVIAYYGLAQYLASVNGKDKKRLLSIVLCAAGASNRISRIDS